LSDGSFVRFGSECGSSSMQVRDLALAVFPFVGLEAGAVGLALPLGDGGTVRSRCRPTLTSLLKLYGRAWVSPEDSHVALRP